MKKHIISIGLIFAALLSTHALAENSITVTFDGKPVTFDTQPQIIDGSVMVPMRKIFETIGAEVNWDDETKTVTAIKNAQYVKFSADNANMEIGVCKDGKNTGETLYYANSALNTAPSIVNGSMLVPARAVSEAFYYDVNWNTENKRVEITTPDNDEGWIYYASWTDGGHMYKIDTNGQNRQLLSENDCFSEGYIPLVYDNGYIYYSVRGDNEGCLYRIKTDGTGEEKLTDMPVELLYDYDTHSPLIGDYIYFISTEKDRYEYGYKGDLYKLNPEKKEITKLLDKEISPYSVHKYGDYIYFRYEDDRLSYYRIDADGEIIKVLDNMFIRNFSVKDDRLSFLSERDGKHYTAALDGSDLQKEDDDADDISELVIKYDLAHIVSKNDNFIVGAKYTEEYSIIYVVIDNDGNELFKVTPPENAHIDYGAYIVGNKIYYSLSPKTDYVCKKIYVDSLDELLGMSNISVSSEKVDGKYEIQTRERESVKSDFESEVHCIDLDKNTDSVILKGYSLSYIGDKEEDKLYLYKETEDGPYESYTSDLDGNNIELYQRPKKETIFSDMINVNEEAEYGIIIKSDGIIMNYPNINQYSTD